MSKSVILGLIFGALVTGAAWYYVSPRLGDDAPATIELGTAGAASESAEAPVVQALGDFQASFPGSDDLIAHRSRLVAFMPLDIWDGAIKATRLPEMAASEGCESIDPAQGIFVPESVGRAIANGTSNILIINRNIPRCFALNSKLALGADELVRGKKLYDFYGEIVIKRIIDPIKTTSHEPFFDALKMNPSDALYLANSDLAPLRRAVDMTMLLVSFNPTTPLVDRTKIPPFVVGAEAVHPQKISTLAKNSRIPMRKPVLVDARDRRYLSAGASYPGAILAPFVSSNPIQVRYQPDLPSTILAGAKFETSALPAERDIPMVVFGNDETDASALWVIRNLRLQNYRHLFYVIGGLKAMNELKQPIAL